VHDSSLSKTHRGRIVVKIILLEMWKADTSLVYCRYTQTTKQLAFRTLCVLLVSSHKE